ncbi:MAG TPA: hypothetical protein VMW38_21380 [Terriglobia bacterium]|nr:hypothetical protein [Terriglobia bacterium]
MKLTTPAVETGQGLNSSIPLLFCGWGLDTCFGCGGQLGPGAVVIETVEIAEGGAPDRGLLSVYHPRCAEEAECLARIWGDVPVRWHVQRVKQVVLNPERLGRKNNVSEVLCTSEEKSDYLRALRIPDTRQPTKASSMPRKRQSQIPKAK